MVRRLHLRFLDSFIRVSALVVVLLLSLGARGQNLITAFPTTWSGTPANVVATSVITGLQSDTCFRGSGLTGVSSTARFNSSAWQTGSPLVVTSNNSYLTITLRASPGYLLNLNSDTILVTVGSSGTGPTNFSVFTSVGGFASTGAAVASGLASSTSSVARTVVLPSSGYDNLSSIEIRIYGYGGTASGGTFGFSSFQIRGGSVPTALPTFNYYSKSTGNLDVLSTWTTDTSGSGGTNPTTFSSATSIQIFNVAHNNPGTITSGTWTVGGAAGSKVIVYGSNLTIGSSNPIAATIDVAAGKTLTIQNTTLPTLGSLASTSTVVYNNGTTNLLNYGLTYGNVTFSGSGTGVTNTSGNFLFAGNLTLQSSASFNAAAVSLVPTGSADQTITGNGLTLSIFDLRCQPTRGKTGKLSLATNTPITVNDHIITYSASSSTLISDGGNTITALNNVQLGGDTSGYNLTGTILLTAASGTQKLTSDTTTSQATVLSAALLNNLEINQSGTGKVTFVTSAPNLVYIRGNFKVTSVGGAITLTSNNIMLSGDFNYLPTSNQFTVTSSTLTFNGTNTQSYTCNVPSTGMVFNNIRLNNIGLGVVMNSPMSVGGNITFTAGKIRTGSNTLFFTPTSAINNGNSSSYVWGSLSEGIAAGATYSKIYPVGDTTFSPVQLISTGSNTVTGTIVVTSTYGAHPQLATAYLTSANLNRYINIVNNGTSGPTTVKLVWSYNIPGDLVSGSTNTNYVARSYNGSTWTTGGTATTPALATTGLLTTGTTQNNIPVASFFGSYVTGVPACTGTPAGGTASASPSRIILSGTSTLTLSGASSGTGYSSQWYTSTDGVNFSPISGATTTTYTTPTLTTTTYYSDTTRCLYNGNSARSTIAAVTVVPPTPTITAVSPNVAVPGSSVTITGTNFNSTASNNKVFFGATRVTPSSGSTTSLTLTVPTGATLAPVTVTDTVAGQTGYSGQNIGYAILPFLPIFDSTGFIPDSLNIKNKVDFSVNGGTGSNPAGVAIGDINGDGKSDFVSANGDSSTLTVFLNTGTTTTITTSSFSNNLRLACPGKPSNIKLADIDGDGKLDIVAVYTNSNDLNVFRNTTAAGASIASFASRSTYSMGTVGSVPAIADFDGDGKADIAVSLPAVNFIAIIANTSTVGTISLAAGAVLTTGSYPLGVVATDLDGDGRPDIAAVNAGFTGSAYSGSTASVFRNTSSSGSFSFGSEVPLTTGSGPIDIVAGDIDNDGIQDLLTTNFNDNTISLFRNTNTSGSISSGSFSASTIASGSSPIGVQVADLNGDRKLDVIVSNGTISGGLSFFRNTTTGTTFSFATAVTRSAGDFPATVTAGDLDGDKFTDIVVGNKGFFTSVPSNTISIFENYPLPRISSVTGASGVCVGDSVTFSDATSGGLWTSANTAVASVTATGVVYGVSGGSTTISYAVVIGADTNYSSQSILVNAIPTGGTITGVSNVCPGTSITLSNATASSGTVSWSTSDAATASVHPTTGEVTGVTNGTAIVTFSVTSTAGCGTAIDTALITVTSTPSAGTLSGATSACEGSSRVLSSTIASGVWSSSFPAIATVDTSAGIVYALSAGVDTIIYTVTNTCGTARATYLFTVNALPATPTAISGTTTFCVGASSTLGSTPSGGTWSTTNAGVASVDASGLVYGVAGGTANISYTISTASCGSNAVGVLVTISAAPTAASISGTTTLCVGASTTLTPTITGGTWSAINAAVASVDASGVVYGVSADTTTILYALSSSCGTSVTPTLITVSPLPATPAAIAGSTSVCVGNTITLTDAVSGGAWSTTSTTIASVNSATGDVTGLSSGTANITYTVSNSCGSNEVYSTVSVTPVSTIGAITNAGAVCTGATISLSDTTAGGSWTTSASSIASVNASGLVNGVAAGSAIITYSVVSACGTLSDTALITVNTIPGAPGAVAGAVIAYGGSVTLTSSTSGGRWSSSNTSIATVDTTSGLVAAVSAGNAIITYTISNTCGSNNDTALVTVSAISLTSISGTQWNTFSGSSAAGPSTFTVVPATTTPGSSVIAVSQWNRSGTTNNTTSGVYNTTNWSAATSFSGALTDNRFNYFTVTNNSSTEAKVTNITIVGQRSATGPQTIQMTYAVGNSGNIGFASSNTTATSSTSYSFTANACIAPGATDTFKLWAFNPATAGSTGGTFRIANTTSITMSYASGVSAISLSSSTNTSPICAGSNFTLNGGTASNGIAPYTYAWSGPASYTSTATASTISSASAAANGTYTLTATDNLGCFISNTTVATVTAIPHVSPISGSSTVSLGGSTTLTDTASGGTWSSSNATVASVSTAGVVTGLTVGTATITYKIVTASCGSDSAVFNITVNPVLYITAVSPNFASPGSSVTISGAGFNGTLNKNNVYFGATRAIPSSGSSTSLTVTVPSGALYGPISVTDTAVGLTAFSGEHASSPISSFLPVFDTIGFLTDTLNFKNKVDFAVTSLTGSKPIGAAIGDINGDGKSDLVSANSDSSSVSIFINSSSTGTISSGSFSLFTKITLPSKPNNVKLADLDGDGKLDIIATATNNTSIIVIRNTTASTSATSFATRQQIAAGSVSSVAGFGDFNGDGKTDIVVSLPAGSLGILKNTSSIGSITFATVSTVTTGTVPSGVAVADFDGDGLADLATVNSGFTGASYAGSTASLFRNTSSVATISFAAATTITTGSGPIDVAAGDVDGDGAMDLLFTNINDGNFSVMRNTSTSGSLSFGTRTSFTAGTGTTGVNVADLNGDGKVDVVVSNALSNSISIFRNTTTGSTPSFAASVTKTSGTTPSTVTVGDLDNDGYTDIVVGNQGTNTLSVFENYPLPRVEAISGTTTLCSGATTTLANVTTGGVWSSNNTSIASIDVTGVVTAVAAGTTTITYAKIINGDTNYVTTPFNVNASPNAGAITGVGSLCPTTTIALTNTTSSGGTISWSSSDTTVAVINASTGVVTGVTTGSVYITYSVVSASCGTATDTAIVNVSSTPTAGTISGTTTLCELATTALSSSVSGGRWYSVHSATASVDSLTGVVTGGVADTVTIVYSVTNSCGTATTSVLVTVNPLPATPAAIDGSSIVCTSSSTTLTNTVSGGTWSSVNPSVASINATTGVLTGVSADTVTIVYTISNSCGSNSVTRLDTIISTPTVAPITGVTPIVIGQVITASSTTSGGTWNISPSGIANISSTGIITGASAGTAIVTYSVSFGTCGSASDTALLTVNSTFGAGNLVVYQVGDTVNTGVQVSVVEYSTSGGSALRTVNLPSTGTTPFTRLVASGTATSEGFFSLDSERVRLVLSGYDTTTGLSGSVSAAGVAARRAVFTMLPSGVANNVAGVANASLYTSNNLRGATGAGNNYFTSGTPGGVFKVSGTGATSISSTVSNTRTVQIFNGQLYMSTGSGGVGVYKVGTGIPTTGGATASIINTTTVLTSAYGFSISPDDKTMYVADDAQGIYKFTRSSSGATFSSPVQINATKCRGIVVDYTTTPYTIYATTATGTRRCTSCNPYSDSLIAITDNGAGSSITYLATAPANTNFRGVTFAPTPTAKMFVTTNTICSGTRDSVIIYGNPGATVNYFINGTAASVVMDATGRKIIDTTFINTSGAAATNTFVLSTISTSVGTFTLSGSNSIVVNSGAIATLSGSASICSGSSATVAISGGTPGATVTLAPGGSTFTLDGSGNGSVAVSRTSDTVFTATIAISGCSGAVTGSFPVTVNPLPTATISGTASIFTGTSTNITFGSTPGAVVYYTASGSGTTDSVTLDGTGSYVMSVTPSVSTSYIITGARSVAGCFNGASDSAVITVSTMPTASISGTATICQGSSTNLVFSGTGAAVVRYTWGSFTDSVTLSGTASGTGTFTVTVSPTVTTTYSLVSLTSGAYTGSLTGSATITVTPIVTAGSVSGTSPLCVGTSATYTASGTTGGTWSSSATAVASVNPSTGTVYALTAGTASIQYRVSNTCFADSSSTTVTVNPLPAFTAISGTTTIISGSSTGITFTGTPSAVVTYTFTGGSPTTTTLDGSGTSTITVSPTITTTYSVTAITSTAGCTNTATGSAVVTVSLPYSRYNIVVNRIGDGVNTLGSNAFPQTVVEYTTSGAATGAQGVIPSGSGVVGTESGSATSGGQMTLDSERTHIIISGYNGVAGTASIANAAGINRTIFSVLPTSIVSNVSNVSQTYAYNTNNIRSATAAGTRYYAAGTASTTRLGGIQLMTDTGASQISRLPASNTRVVQIFNGQLYYSTSSATPVGIYKVGNGIPTDTANVATNVTTSGTTGITSPYGFSFSPDKRTMYIADDASTTGGIYRFDRTADTGTFAFTRRVTTTTSRSLVVDYTTSPYIIYATTGSSAPNHIIKINDTGASARQDTLAASGTKYIFRGIMFSPASYAKVKGTVATVCSGTADTVVVYGNPGSTVSYTFNGSASTVSLDGTGMKRLGLGTLTNTTPYPVVDTFRITGVTTSLGTTTLSDSTLITVNPLPFVPAITGVTPVCVGSSITVADTAVGGTWSSFDTTIAVISSGGVVTARAAGVDTIYYAKTNSCGTTTVSAVINVNALPLAGTVTPSFTSGCTSSLLTLTNTGATGTGTLVSYNWSGPGYSHTSTAAVDTVTPLTTAMSGVFSLSVTYSGVGCTSSVATTSTVTINPAPALYTVTGGGSYCGTTAVSLGLSGSDTGVIYQLYRDGSIYGTAVAGTGSSISFAASTDTGVYTVFATATAGCTNTMSGSASIVDHTTSITSLGVTPAVCQPTTTAFMTYSASGAPVTYNITWDATASAAGFPDVVSGVLGAGFFNIPLDTTAIDTFYATITVSNGFCTSSASSLHVATYAQPVATISSVDTALCSGHTANILFTGTPGANFRYQVNGGSLITATIPTGGTYTLVTGGISSRTVYTLHDVYNPACSNTFGDSVVINPVSMQWIGGTSGAEHDWNTASNWLCGMVPGASDAVTIPLTTYYPAIASAATGTAGSLTIDSAASVVVGASGSLNVKALFKNNGSVTGTGKVVLNGTSPQIIQGLGKVEIFELDNVNGATISSTSSRLRVDSVLMITSGTLTTNDSLLIYADTIRTARVAPIGSGGAISGQARVLQTIIGGYRRYRFWSQPFSNTIPYSQMQNYIDLTGPGGTANGFTYTPTNSPSVYRYSTLAGNSTLSYDPGWKVVTSALSSAGDSNKIHRYEGVRVYMRGKKGEGFGYGTYYPHATVIGQWGNLNQGRQVVTLTKGSSTGQDYNLLGNPYASPVDLGTVAFNAKVAGNIIGSFYVWNPTMGAGGQFVAYPISTLTATPYYIQANAAFEVRAAHNNDTLVFNETDKNDTSTAVLLRQSPEYTTLYIYDEAYHPWDVLRMKFDENATDEQDNVNDADKLMGGDLNFYSFSSDNKRQTVDVRPYNADKVIPLGITSSYAQDFIIRAEDVVVPENSKLFLHDKLLSQYVELNQGAEYHFSITKDPSTQGNNRFEIAMKPASVAFSGLEVTMTPNPASDDVKLGFRSGTAEEVSIRVTDMSGVTVYNKGLGVQQNGVVNIPLDKFAAGIYMVELTSGNKKVVHRLVKE